MTTARSHRPPPDCDAATVKVWLSAHPGVELVSRDRASSYSQAATEAAAQRNRSPTDGIC